MNAVLQQLFMQPKVRKGLLGMDGIPFDQAKDSFLFQMQRAFAFLQESNSQYFTPDGIWTTYRHWGQPINVREQMDAFECFNNIVDQIDEALKALNLPKAMSNVFGGMFADQKIIKV